MELFLFVLFHQEIITEEDSESSSDFDEESSEDEDSGGGGSHQSGGSIKPIDLDIGNTLKRILEQDYELINHKHKLAVLPAQPTVCSILESWVQHFTTTQLTNIPEKPQRNKTNITLEKTITDINLCRECADGLRIYFDFTLPDILLYRHEREQYNTFKTSIAIPEISAPIKTEVLE